MIIKQNFKVKAIIIIITVAWRYYCCIAGPSVVTGYFFQISLFHIHKPDKNYMYSYYMCSMLKSSTTLIKALHVNIFLLAFQSTIEHM